MDSEYKKELDEVLKLSEENNQYVKKIRSAQKTSQIFKIIYWAFIICVMFGGFYFVQPYVTNIINLYNGGIGALQSVHNIQSSAVPKK